MKIVERLLPYVLLISFLALNHFQEASIADSIIIIALAALVGFKELLKSKEQKNYAQEFQDTLSKQQKEIEDLKTSIGMYNIATKKKQENDNIVW